MQAAQAQGFDYFQGYFFSRPVIVSTPHDPGLPPELPAPAPRAEPARDRHAAARGRGEAGGVDDVPPAAPRQLGGLRVPARDLEPPARAGPARRTGDPDVRHGVGDGRHGPRRARPNSWSRRRCARACARCSRRSRRCPTGRSTCSCVGMFSSLDAILDQPMERILQSLPLGGDVREALLGGRNPLRGVLDCVHGLRAGPVGPRVRPGRWQPASRSGRSPPATWKRSSGRATSSRHRRTDCRGTDPGVERSDGPRLDRRRDGAGRDRRLRRPAADLRRTAEGLRLRTALPIRHRQLLHPRPQPRHAEFARHRDQHAAGAVRADRLQAGLPQLLAVGARQRLRLRPPRPRRGDRTARVRRAGRRR